MSRCAVPTRSRVIGVLPALVLALGVSACGGAGGSEAGSDGQAGETSATQEGGASELDGVSIVATGAIEGLGLGPDAWGFGILIENSNAETRNVRLRAFAFDAGGQLIDTSKEVLIPVQAESRGGAVGQFLGVRPDQDVAAVDVVIEGVDSSWFGTSTITVADVEQQDTRVIGVVTSDAGQELRNTSVVALVLDSSGAIVGGGVDVMTVPASGNTPFDVLLSGAPTANELIVVASPSGVDL